MGAMATLGFFRRAAVLAFAWGGCGGAFGCNLGQGYADFGKDVTQPEQVVIDGPGTKIADGQMSGMLVDPWGDQGAVVVGFRYMDDGPHLRMQPFDGAKGCNVGRAYRCIVFTRLPNEPQLIAYLDDESTLHFADHSCNVVYGDIKNSELPERLFDAPPGFVVKADDQLLDIDPFRKKTRVIARNVRSWSGPGDPDVQVPIWYISDGQLVVLDDARQERLRLGRDVTEVIFEASDPTRGLFLVDGGALTHYQEATGLEPKTLATDVCRASLGSYGISYYSPCGESKLVVQDPAKGTKYEVDSGVGRLFYAQLRASGGEVGGEAQLGIEAVYTKASTTEPGYDDLWLKQVGAAPRLWQSRLGAFISATTGDTPTLVAVVDSNGTIGRLIRVDATGESALAEGIVLSYPIETVAGGWLVMTDLKDGYGNLTRISDTGEKALIAERVSTRAPGKPRRDPQLTAITDERYFDLRAYSLRSDVGNSVVGLLDGRRLDSLYKLGTNVPPAQFKFFSNMTAIGYLDRFDDDRGTGSLSVYQTRIGATSIVSKDVNEFTELLWPYEGVIYSVKQDDKYSLWAARAKP